MSTERASLGGLLRGTMRNGFPRPYNPLLPQRFCPAL